MDANIFNAVKKNVDIAKEIGSYIDLKKIGGYLKGLCPFKCAEIKSILGTFVVSPGKQIFYCFGCHMGGDVISFISLMEKLTPSESIIFLCNKYQLNIKDMIEATDIDISESQEPSEIIKEAVDKVEFGRKIDQVMNQLQNLKEKMKP